MRTVIKSFKTYPIWWLIIFIVSATLAIFTNEKKGLDFILGGALGFMFAAMLFTFIFLFVCWLIKKPLNPRQYMYTYSIAFFLVALSIANNFSTETAEWNSEVQRGYLTECIRYAKSHVKGQYNDQKINDYCQCGLDKIKTTYTVTELKKEEPSVKEGVAKIYQDCSKLFQ